MVYCRVSNLQIAGKKVTTFSELGLQLDDLFHEEIYVGATDTCASRDSDVKSCPNVHKVTTPNIQRARTQSVTSAPVVQRRSFSDEPVMGNTFRVSFWVFTWTQDDGLFPSIVLVTLDIRSVDSIYAQRWRPGIHTSVKT